MLRPKKSKAAQHGQRAHVDAIAPGDRNQTLATSPDPVLFVSYSHSDKKYVDCAEPNLRNVAESCGLELFIDERKLRPGEAWRATIEDKLQRARAAVVFVSSEYLDRRRFAATELAAILTNNRLGKLTCFVVPVDKVDPNLPKEFEELSEIHWVLPPHTPLAAMSPEELRDACRELNGVIGRHFKKAADEPRSLEEFARTEVARTLNRKYQIGECLGSSRSSVVFEAEDTALRRTVAIKVLVHARYEIAVAEQFVESAKVAAGLRHENIAQVLTSQLQSSPYYVVMECISGSSLDKLLKQKGALDAETAFRYFDQVANALALIHQHGIYHGAIRPSNVLVDMTNPRGRAVLSLHWRRAAKHQAGGGLTFEELTYLTPEQYFGGEMDAKTDQYQLGQLLYALLTGEPPGRVNVLADLQTKPAFFADPTLLLAESSLSTMPAVCDALTRMLNRRPEARWSSIEDAREAIRYAFEGTDPRLKAARASFERCVKNANFLPSIYAALFDSCKELEAIFVARKTNFERQHVRLTAALTLLFEAYKGTDAALRTVDAYGQQHAEMGVEPGHYDDFLVAILRAARVADADAWSDSLEDAWRTTLSPGIGRMKRAGATKRVAN